VLKFPIKKLIQSLNDKMKYINKTNIWKGRRYYINALDLNPEEKKCLMIFFYILSNISYFKKKKKIIKKLKKDIGEDTF